jgi:CHASE3 domain sensor protein
MPEYDYRFSKIDDAIQKVAAVLADLSKMLAVQEQRLTQQEKNTDKYAALMEKREDNLERKFNDIYETIRKEDQAIFKKINEEIVKNRELSAENHKEVKNTLEKQDQRIGRLEKLVLLATGSAMTLGFLLGMAEKYLKFFS